MYRCQTLLIVSNSEHEPLYTCTYVRHCSQLEIQNRNHSTHAVRHCSQLEIQNMNQSTHAVTHCAQLEIKNKNHCTHVHML